jgi:hypothetical protein
MKWATAIAMILTLTVMPYVVARMRIASESSPAQTMPQ